MATYKKNNNRPNRQKDTEHLDEAKQAQLHKESTTAEVFDALDAGATRTEDWVKRNQKIIIGTLIAVAVIGLGYLLYQQFVKAPREKNAANELFRQGDAVQARHHDVKENDVRLERHDFGQGTEAIFGGGDGVAFPFEDGFSRFPDCAAIVHNEHFHGFVI